MSKTREIGAEYGLSDPDLATPGHDAILIELARIWPEFLKSKLGDGDTENDAELICSTVDKVRLPKNARTPADIGQLTWEYPIVTGGGRPRAFLDLAGTYSVPKLIREPLYRTTSAFSGYELREKVDRDTQLIWTRETYFVGIEAKTEIRSAGELLRQLQTYGVMLRQHQASSQSTVYLFVVSPDDRFRDVIESQRFNFVKFPIQL